MLQELKTSTDFIEYAFIELLSTVEYEDINITMLTKKAGVARVTFYRNYNCIEDVLNSVINNLLRDFTQFINIAFAKKDPDIWRTFITIFLERIMCNKDRIYKLTPSNKLLVFDRIDRKFKAVLKEKNIENISIENKYKYKIKFAIIATVASEWGFDGFKDSITDLANYIVDILVKLS